MEDAQGRSHALDAIEGTLRRVRGEVEARKSGTRPRSLNLTTLYCNEVPAAQPSPISLALPSTVPTTPAPSVTSSSVILVRHRPLSPPALRLQRSVSSTYRQPTPDQRRALYRQASAASSSQLRRKQGRSSRRWARIGRGVSELALFLIGFRHLLAEIPLLVLLVLAAKPIFREGDLLQFGRPLGPLFYLTLTATLAPGLAALVDAFRSGAVRGASCLHSAVRCLALVLRLESLLRVVELSVPSWGGGPPWQSRVSMAQASAGSAPQLLLQAAVLGWCSRPQLLEPEPEDLARQLVVFGHQQLPECNMAVALLQAAVVLVSALHLAWALAAQSRPKLDTPAQALDPSVWRLVKRTSMGVGVVANLLIAGSRASLVLVAIAVGWSWYHVLGVCGGLLALRLAVSLVRWGLGKGAPDLAMTVCSLVAIEPGASSPRILARRCMLAAAENAGLLVGVALRTHGATAAGLVYRLAVLHAAASLSGVLLLFARLRWVHATPGAPSPVDGGKCYSQYVPDDDI